MELLKTELTHRELRSMELKNLEMDDCLDSDYLKGFEGSTISVVEDFYGPKGDEGVTFDCKDGAGNRFVLIIKYDGSVLFHDGCRYAKKKLTVEQYGNIAKLSKIEDVISVSIEDRGYEGVQIMILIFSEDGADCVLEDIKDMFPELKEISIKKESLESKFSSVYIGRDHDYFLDLTINVHNFKQ